jgi:cellulose biosynthesis protein BcsE
MIVSIMNNSVIPATPPPAIRIGISGLPSITSTLVAGGVYVLVAEIPSARFPMLSAGLADALNDGIPCTIILPTNPQSFIQRIESFCGINTTELINNDRLQMFVMQDEFVKNMFRLGAESFILELDQFEIPNNSYLIFEQADDLLSLHDISQAMEQVDILKKWFAQKGVTALLVFSRTTDAHSGTINALMDNLNGIVRLGGDGDGLEFTFDYWQSPEGSIAARRYRLLTLDSGLYEASIKVSPATSRVTDGGYERAGDIEDAEPHFFYMDPDLGNLARDIPGVWQQVDSMVGMVHATRNARSVTSILSFQHDTNLRQLAETVHTLRRSLERHAQIVVQEKGASLRYQNEALLVKLGINLVIHRDVPNSRLPLLLESLSGQIFNRDVDINFEAAIASVIPTRFRGYLLPLNFVREVELILDRAETLKIPCAMIVGQPSPNMKMADIMASISLSRLGDLLTTDGQSCYLFLNACPQSVMLTTLERILGMSVNAAFDDLRLLVQREDIHSELAVLESTAKRVGVPDYSSISGKSAFLPGRNSPQVIEEIPFVTQDLTSMSSTAANESTSATLPSSSFDSMNPALPGREPRLAVPSPKQSATVTADAASTIKHENHRNSFNRRTGSPVESPILNDGSKHLMPVFGKLQTPRARRSS